MEQIPFTTEKTLVNKILGLYKPAHHKERIPTEEIKPLYTKYRLQVMISIFLGYAGYYFVRQNFSLAKPYLLKSGFNTGDLGLIASALTIAYALSKFLMGNVSDRSNPRYFMATGLILSGIVNIFFGFLPSVSLMVVFWFINGWLQGMGWAPCARTITHWFSHKERGTKFAIWNLAHNVGAGTVAPIVTVALAVFVSWQCIFYTPGIIAVLLGIFVIITLRDTPQSEGLPPIEEYANDYPETATGDKERELTSKEIFFQYVFNNKYLWILSMANLFAYIVRYGVVNWAPTYLQTIKHCPPDAARWQFLAYEYAGIGGMLLSGWASDRIFNGRRSPVSVIFMAIITGAIFVYWLNPPGKLLIDSISLIAIGFLIYGPIMLIGVAAVDLVPKKAAGTAAGLTGLFGYIGATFAEAGIGKIVQFYGWDKAFMILIASAVLSTLLLIFTWNAGGRSVKREA